MAASRGAEVNIAPPLRSKKNRFILLGMTEAAPVRFQYRGREISQEDNRPAQ